MDHSEFENCSIDELMHELDENFFQTSGEKLYPIPLRGKKIIEVLIGTKRREELRVWYLNHPGIESERTPKLIRDCIQKIGSDKFP